MINKKVRYITSNVINTINNLHNGIAVPKINTNNVYNFSKYDNSDLIALNVFWNIMKQNNYNNDIRGIIITPNDSKNLADYYYNMVDSDIDNNDQDYDNFYDYVKVVDANTYHSDVLLGSTTIKRYQTKTDKTLLYVTNPFSDTETMFADTDDIIVKIKPNILIFINGDTLTDTINHIIKNYPNMSIINLVMTSIDVNISRHDELLKNNNKLKYYIIDIPIYSHNADNTDNIQNIVESILLCINNNDICKGVVIFDDINAKITFDVYDYYYKYYMDYDICKNLHPCINLDDITKIGKNDKNDKKLIFVGKNDINDIHNENSNCFNNIDCIIDLSHNTIKNTNDNTNFLMNTMILTQKTKKNLVYVRSIDSTEYHNLNEAKRKNKIYRNIASHICDYSNIIHDGDNIKKYDHIILDINTGDIQIHVNNVNIVKLYKKIETILEITDDNKRFMKRNNIGFVITIPKNDDSDIKKYFDEEYKYILNKSSVNDDQILYDQFEIISSNKRVGIPKYIGGKWISRSDKIEIPGNVLCFANENSNKLYVCKIIGVKKYTRRDKRAVWKEKDAKGKNILFISNIKKTYKLSDFKTDVNHKGKMSYMQEFEYNFDI